MESVKLANVNLVQNSPALEQGSSNRSQTQGVDFGKILQTQLAQQPVGKIRNAFETNELKFSAHAMNRIRDRGINMGQKEMLQLSQAVDKAAEKGAKEALVLMNDSAFIVSVKNRTVITAMDKTALNGNVFTNIDSTVVV